MPAPSSVRARGGGSFTPLRPAAGRLTRASDGSQTRVRKHLRRLGGSAQEDAGLIPDKRRPQHAGRHTVAPRELSGPERPEAPWFTHGPSTRGAVGALPGGGLCRPVRWLPAGFCFWPQGASGDNMASPRAPASPPAELLWSQNHLPHSLSRAHFHIKPLFQDWEGPLLCLIHVNKSRNSNKMKRQRNISQMKEQERSPRGKKKTLRKQKSVTCLMNSRKWSQGCSLNLGRTLIKNKKQPSTK